MTSVAHNDKIDQNLIAAARRELERHDPDLLVLQLLAVDQNGHTRGTYYPEYVERIGITDGLIEEFIGWCEERGHLQNAAVILMADHGQGRGIGAHGHFRRRTLVPSRCGQRIAQGRCNEPAPSWSRPDYQLPPRVERPRLHGRVLTEALDWSARETPRRRHPREDEEATIGELLDRLGAVRVPA